MSEKGEEPEECPSFVDGEKILCFHGPLIYEAKVQRVRRKNGVTQYLIHYHGWNKNWDEWVPDARMLKYTSMNLEKKRELSKAHEANARAAKKANLKRKLDSPTTTGSTGSSTVNTEGVSATGSKEVAKSSGNTDEQPASGSQQPSRKAKGKKKDDSEAATPGSSTSTSSKTDDLTNPPDETVETEELFHAKVEVKVKIPDKLKPFLVDDWDYLTRQRKLVILPSRITVDEVINEYVKVKTAKKPETHKENAILEVTAGLREYFNVMLGSQLLYKFEREQHADIMKEHPDKPMCKIYGPIHFLRLFVKLGSNFTYTPLDDKSIQLLLFYIDDFLTFLAEKRKDFFMIEDYGTAPPEYHRRAL